MYHSYTATNNLALTELPEKINPLINSIISSNPKKVKSSELEIYHYMDEPFVDVVSFFKEITNHRDTTQQKKYSDFIDFFNQSIIFSLKQNGTLLEPIRRRKKLSGLGLFLPTSKNKLDKYVYLQVFSDLRLVELFDAILFN
jgi:hypothetical protein